MTELSELTVKTIKGVPCLVSEEDVIDLLGIRGSERAKGHLAYLKRTRRLVPVRMGFGRRALKSYRIEDVKRHLASIIEDHERRCRPIRQATSIAIG